MKPTPTTSNPLILTTSEALRTLATCLRGEAKSPATYRAVMQRAGMGDSIFFRQGFESGLVVAAGVLEAAADDLEKGVLEV